MNGERVGHIRIVEALGQGGMGTVYIGFDETLRRKVALKAIRGERLDDSTKGRFIREARVLSQLEHPSICRIYDYVEHDGNDYLVLELVDGRSLGDALTNGELDEAAKLDLSIQMADALAAAHAQGVVHRDLKPDNVMVTPEGVAKILDFGLARTADEEPEEARPDPTAGPVVEDESVELSLASALRTDDGLLMGTPLFMSPEQARAEPVTTASDMYSFGLLLQTIFTGKRPYPSSIGMIPLLRRAAAGETEPVEGLAKDLTDVIERLKVLAPAGRATAVDTLERLEWIRDKPKRRARRLAVGAVLVLAVLAGVKYTVDLEHERGRAVHARDIADQRRGQAEDLIDFMLVDLRAKLEGVGRLDVLDDVGQEALEYFAAVPEAELTNAELARRSKALYQLGEVQLFQGNLDGATQAFREALRECAGLVERDPENTEALETLGNSHFWVGTAHFDRGEWSDALREFEAYRDITRRLAELEPGEPKWRLEVVYGEGNVGRALEAQGEYEQALGPVQRRLDLMEELAATDPTNTLWQEELASSHIMVGTVKESLGDYDGALAHYRSDLGIFGALAELDPEHTGWQERLATSYGYVASGLEARGDYEPLDDLTSAYLGLAESLAERDPANTLWQDILAMAHRSVARQQSRRGDTEAAHTHARNAVEVFRALADLDPEATRWQRELASSRMCLGRILGERGEIDGALDQTVRARALLEMLCDRDAADPVAQREWTESLLLEGDFHARIGRAEEASGAWRRAFEVIEPLARDSRDGKLLAPLAVALVRLERAEEAQPILDQLHSLGFVDRRLEGLVVGS